MKKNGFSEKYRFYISIEYKDDKIYLNYKSIDLNDLEEAKEAICTIYNKDGTQLFQGKSILHSFTLSYLYNFGELLNESIINNKSALIYYFNCYEYINLAKQIYSMERNSFLLRKPLNKIAENYSERLKLFINKFENYFTKNEFSLPNIEEKLSKPHILYNKLDNDSKLLWYKKLIDEIGCLNEIKKKLEENKEEVVFDYKTLDFYEYGKDFVLVHSYLGKIINIDDLEKLTILPYNIEDEIKIWKKPAYIALFICLLLILFYVLQFLPNWKYNYPAHVFSFFDKQEQSLKKEIFLYFETPVFLGVIFTLFTVYIKRFLPNMIKNKKEYLLEKLKRQLE